MDKNTFTGLFLIMVIVAGWVYFTKPTPAQLQKERMVQHQDSLKKAGKTTASAATITADTAKIAKTVIDTAALKSPFGASLNGKEEFGTLSNKDIQVKFTNKGGRIYSVELKNYKTFDGKPLILFEGDQNKFGFSFAAGVANVNKRSILIIYIHYQHQVLNWVW
jgi:YidC/Oxa1 family membrane protein insertase